jgi:hypothetical protein
MASLVAAKLAIDAAEPASDVNSVHMDVTPNETGDTQAFNLDRRLGRARRFLSRSAAANSLCVALAPIIVNSYVLIAPTSAEQEHFMVHRDLLIL